MKRRPGTRRAFLVRESSWLRTGAFTECNCLVSILSLEIGSDPTVGAESDASPHTPGLELAGPGP